MNAPITSVSARSFDARSSLECLRRATTVACMCAAAAWIAGCGGGADAPPPPEQAVVVVPTPPTQSAPVLTQQPSDSCVAAPTAATFTAAASGVPAPTVQWQRSSDAGATWTAIAGATAATFTTAATAVSDDGARFRAVFANAAGTAISNGASLTVESATASRLTLLAGTLGGPGNLDGCSTAARFSHPEGVAVDAAGVIYVADTGNQLIRKITTAGVVSTLAGQSGVKGGADGTGNTATFSDPTGITVDAAGIVYVTDATGSTLRRITPTGVVSTLAGSFGTSGSANGQGAAANFATPLGIAHDTAGNLYVADQGNSAIRMITPAGVVTTFAALLDAANKAPVASGLAIDGTGNVYVGVRTNPQNGGDEGTLYDDAQVWRYKPTGVFDRIVAGTGFGNADGTGAAASFDYPVGLAADASGNVYVADACNNQIRKISTAAVVTSLAGSPPSLPCRFDEAQSVDGIGAAAGFDQPSGVAVDPGGNVVVADTLGDVIRRVGQEGAVTTVAGTTTLSGSSDGTGAAARFFFANDGGYAGFTSTDAAGNVIVTDPENGAVRKITPAGVVSTFVPPLVGFSLPEGIAIDAAGHLDIVEFGGDRVVQIAPSGAVSTLVGVFPANLPWGGAIDAAGNLYVSEPFGNIIVKVTPSGTVLPFVGSQVPGDSSGSADGQGSAASFTFPQGIAIDAAGNLYVADTNNDTIRKVTPSGDVTTFAGSAGVAGSADGTGSAARFNGPDSVAVDAAGNVYVADTGNSTIRKITPGGVTTTIVGVAGEVGVRVSADPRLALPQGISVNGNQLVFISANAVFSYALP